MLARLIYASEVTAALNPAAVSQIVAAASTRNARLQVTGMLAFDSGHFLQVLEGRRSVLGELFARIAADPRHCRIELMEVRPVDERLFPHWAMGFAAADAANAPLFLRFGNSDRFEPAAMSAAGAVGLLQALGPDRWRGRLRQAPTAPARRLQGHPETTTGQRRRTLTR